MHPWQRLAVVLDEHPESLLEQWLGHQDQLRPVRAGEATTERRAESAAFLRALREGLKSEPNRRLEDQGWVGLRRLLTELTQSRAREGRSAEDTAHFVLSLRRPLVARLHEACPRDAFLEALGAVTELFDDLALHVTGAYQKTRDEVIRRQQQEMLELSTPVIKLWDGILALPIIGTLDSARTQTVMENLLQRIVETGSDIAIIDITGVPTVDTLTAQHLLKTVTATRLMGGECIISGIRPQIAQTLVHLGVNLGDVLTRSTLASALALALKRHRLTIEAIHPSGEPAQEACR